MNAIGPPRRSSGTSIYISFYGVSSHLGDWRREEMRISFAKAFKRYPLEGPKKVALERRGGSIAFKLDFDNALVFIRFAAT